MAVFDAHVCHLLITRACIRFLQEQAATHETLQHAYFSYIQHAIGQLAADLRASKDTNLGWPTP